MQVILAVLAIILLFWLLFGVLFAAIWYASTGLQPKIIGWPITILTFVYLLRMVLVWDIFAIIAFADFAFTIGVIFSFGRSDDEDWSRETLSIRFSTELNRYTGIKRRVVDAAFDNLFVYPIITSVFWIFSAFYHEVFKYALVGSLASLSVILLSIQFHGGKREKAWSKLKEFFGSKLKLLPHSV